MSTFLVSNDEMDFGHLNIQFPRVSSQLSYADITTLTTPQVVSDAVFVFCKGSGAGTINLVLPATSVGRNLFIVNRATNVAINSQNSSGSAISNIVDVENDPNASTPTVQNTILASGATGWVHLVGNGRYWVAVSKSAQAP